MATASSSSPSAAASTAAPKVPTIVREESTVTVRGVAEHWRLEWRKPPTPSCMDDAWYTCPCHGIEFGEEGELDLVRERPGEPEDRIHLDALFTDRTARLPRWQTLPADQKDLTTPPSAAALRERPLVRVMRLGDYDHDGHATELVLRGDYQACGHFPALVVGVDDHDPKLHAFVSVEKPKEPIWLENAEQWEKVKKTLPITLVAIPCGDHGAETQTTHRLERDAAGLHFKVSEAPCR